jgi:hypothetical protein
VVPKRGRTLWQSWNLFRLGGVDTGFPKVNLKNTKASFYVKCESAHKEMTICQRVGSAISSGIIYGILNIPQVVASARFLALYKSNGDRDEQRE